MSTPRLLALWILAINSLLEVSPAGAQQQDSAREARYQRYWEFPSLVRGGAVQPGWLPDGRSFWYADHAPDSTVIYRVRSLSRV